MGNRLIKAEQVLKHYYDGPCCDASCSAQLEVEADKTKSISDMTQRELYALNRRLDSEIEAQRRIRDMKRFSGERDTFDDPMITDVSTPVNQLYHHGIAGMKWGVRRFQNSDGTRTSAGKKRDAVVEERQKSEDHTKSRADKTKGIDALSNDDLKKLNERLQLESTYKTLSASQIKQGESFVGKALKDAAGQALTDVAKNSMVAAAKLVIKEVSPSFAETAFKMKDKT
ncbi:MAG: hypothetical protein RSC06_11065 [Clostridia bacterium]